jgi:hypothetical protein
MSVFFLKSIVIANLFFLSTNKSFAQLDISSVFSLQRITATPKIVQINAASGKLVSGIYTQWLGIISQTHVTITKGLTKSKRYE